MILDFETVLIIFEVEDTAMFFSGSFEKSVVFLNNKLDIQIVSTDLGLEEKPFCGVDILVPIEVNDDIAVVPVGLNLKLTSIALDFAIK